MRVGVLALQGNFREHIEILTSLSVEAVQVRIPADLDTIEALIIPGGESTAISKLMSTSGVFKALSTKNLPIMGTCAGMILSAREVVDGVREQKSLQVFDAVVRRNGVGRQIASFEIDLQVDGVDRLVKAAFIRPPIVEQTGANVEVLARWNGAPVLCREGKHLFATFHPEVCGETRIHEMFLERL